MPPNSPPHAAVGTPSTCSSSASYSHASLVDCSFCRLPLSGFASSQRAHAFVEDPARAMSLSRCAANLLAVKLVRVAPGIEAGVALRAISSGLVDSALGEDHVLVRCPPPLAASELSLRKPTHAAKAAPVVCAANRFPVRRCFPFHRFAFSPFHRFLPRR